MRKRFLVILAGIFLLLSSCSPQEWIYPVATLTPSSTPSMPPTITFTLTATSTLTPTFTSTATLSPTFTPTLTPSFTPTESPIPEMYKTLNINEFGSYTLYWKRALWEQAKSGNVNMEDFEDDKADYGELSFPFQTGNGFLLDGGQISAQILRDSNLITSGNLLHFRSWSSGLRFIFPNETTIPAFGFDFRASEDWKLTIGNSVVNLPPGREGFIGIVLHDVYPSKFTLSSSEKAQGGLSVDNISFVKNYQP